VFGTAPTLTNPTITVRDNAFTLQDQGDNTKQLQLELSGITSGVTRTLTVPDANTTLVGTNVTQTLTGKTLTTPTIAQINNTGGVAVQGTNTNDSAAAGYVGEYVESVIVFGSAISLTTATPANLTSISLTAGDWDVRFLPYFAPAGATNVTQLLGSISTTSATEDFTPGRFNLYTQAAAVPGGVVSVAIPPIRVSLAATTTIYAIVRGTFTVSTMTSYGIISARRVR
jgi:hypothetical protein